MPYIGRDLNRGNYLKLDDISSSFNSSTKTFNLTVGGSAFTPGSAFSILVSVGGVIQEPESAYQVNNSEITFANAPTAQDGFFCLALAVPLAIGVPGNGTVNGSQMAKPFNYDGFFYLNDASNRVGINSSIPTASLDVIGDIKLNGSLVNSGGGLQGNVYAASGISTFNDLRVTNNLTVEGTTTTLDTNLIGVDRIEVGANSNSVVGVAITQSGTADILNLYDGSTEVFSVADGGAVTATGNLTISNTSPSIQLTDTDHNSDFNISGSGGNYVVRDTTHGQNRFLIDSSGNVDIQRTLDVGAGLNVTGAITATSDFIVPDKLLHSGDTNTAIRFPANDTVTVETAGSERLRIDSNGNIGVNTVPSTSGTLYDTVDHFLVIGDNDTGIAQDGDGQFEIWANQQEIINFSTAGIDPKKSILPNQAVNIGQTSQPISHIYSSNITLDSSLIHNGDTDTFLEFGTNTISFDTAGSERLRINSSGRVGINTTTDSMDGVTGNLNIANTNFNNYTVINLSRNTVNDRSQIRFSNPNGNVGSIDTLNSDFIIRSAGALRFDTNSGERLHITSAGNVGIKSTAPRGRLDIQFDGAPSFITFGSDADNPKVEFFRSTGGSPSHYATEIQQVLGDLVLSTAATANLGSHSYVEKVRILSNGKVGINTTVVPYGNFSVDHGQYGLTRISNHSHLLLQNKNAGTTDFWSVAPRDNARFGIGRGTPDANGTVSDEKFTILSDGKIGIGTNVPSKQLSIYGDSDTCIRVTSALNGTASIQFGDTSDTVKGGITYFNSDDTLRIRSHNNNEAIAIDSSERVIIGHTATDDRDGYNSALQVTGTGGDDSSITIGRWSDNQSSPALVFSKSRNGTIGSHTALSGNEYLGAIQFQGDDGSNYHVGASIQARVENFSGGAGSDDMPTRIIFNTNRDEANVGNRMIIHGRGTDYGVLYGGRVDILGYEGQNITGSPNSNVLNEQFLVCPSAADGYADSHTITFGQAAGNWEQGAGSSNYDTSYGLMWHYGGQYNSTRELRAGIHYDHKGVEKFKFWSSYGDITFKTTSSNKGSRTSEELDYEPLRITNTGRVGINRGGTASVDYTLDVDGQSVFRNWIRFGSGGTIKSTAYSGGSTPTYDTGISVNAYGYGGGMVIICNQNFNAGTGTRAGVYHLWFYYDGNHQPPVTHMGGSNFVTFGKSASNTLTISMGAGNNMFTYFGSGLNI